MKPTHDPVTTRIFATEAARLADSSRKFLAAAEEIGIANKPLTPFPLDQTERAMLAELTALPEQLRKTLTGRRKRVTLTDATAIVMSIAGLLVATEKERRTSMLVAARKLLYCIHCGLLTPAWRSQARKQIPTRLIYQLKITLVGIAPAIWRRIQIKDCSFDKLHEHIQTAMGWTNSHLHRFDIDGQQYGDPALLEEDFHEMNYRDSTITLISSELSEDNPRFCLRYEYDFGDSWEHDVLFEGCPQAVPGQMYPLCLEGERACPPEDVGGVHGYAKFVKTIRNRCDKERVGTLEWAQGWFDPDEFDPTIATKSMWKGIPDWRTAD